MIRLRSVAKMIDVQNVARVLRLIAETPHRRQHPLPTDIAGRFDYWFDGGACLSAAGSAQYVLTDGTRATVWTRLQMYVTLEFPGGVRVEIIQKPPVEEAEDTTSGEGWIVE